MIDYIDMPIPYIMGLPREYYSKIADKKGIGWLPSDAILFDIDERKFCNPVSNNEFPQTFIENLTKDLEYELRSERVFCV